MEIISPPSTSSSPPRISRILWSSVQSTGQSTARITAQLKPCLISRGQGPNHQERLLLKNAPWKEINARIARALDSTPAEGTLQQRTDRLMSVVLEAVLYLNSKGQAIAIRKAMVDIGLDTAPSYIHILEKSRLLRATGRTERCTPGKNS